MKIINALVIAALCAATSCLAAPNQNSISWLFDGKSGFEVEWSGTFSPSAGAPGFSLVDPSGLFLVTECGFALENEGTSVSPNWFLDEGGGGVLLKRMPDDPYFNLEAWGLSGGAPAPTVSDSLVQLGVGAEYADWCGGVSWTATPTGDPNVWQYTIFEEADGSPVPDRPSTAALVFASVALCFMAKGRFLRLQAAT